ncbi:unnamed protein product [Prunus brigantina]
MPPKKKTRSNTMASQDGPDHGNSESSQMPLLEKKNMQPSEENKIPPQEESAAAGIGSKQKGPSFVTQEDVIAMLKNELSRSHEDWKYVPQPLYPSSLLQEPYPKGYEAPSFIPFDRRKGSPKEHVNQFIDALGPHAALFALGKIWQVDSVRSTSSMRKELLPLNSTTHAKSMWKFP